jgi:hypothetical protein
MPTPHGGEASICCAAATADHTVAGIVPIVIVLRSIIRQIDPVEA